jgi:acyl carrier protein
MRHYDQIAELLRARVHEILAEEGFVERPGDDDSLVDSGLIDSLSVVEIAVFMESEFGVDFSVVYFDINHFETIATMVRFVEQTLGRAQ